MSISRFLINISVNVALPSFRTVVSRKLTESVEISCVNLIDGTTLLR